MADDIAHLRAALWSARYRPVAVLTGEKRPDALDWGNRARRHPPHATTVPTSHRAASTGILCDGLRAIDIDVTDAALASEVEALARQILGDGPVRFRADSAKRLILYRAASDEPKKRFVGGGKASPHKIEALGHGQQFVAYGRHPDGADYEWRDGVDPLASPLSHLTAVTEDQVTAFLDAAASIIGVPTEGEREAARSHVPASGQGQRIAPSDSARLKSYAISVLDRLASDLATMGRGGRNDALNSAAMRAGALAARGWLDAHPAQSALIAACEANGLVREDGGPSVRATLNSGWRAGLANPARDPDDRDDASDWPCVINLRPRTYAVSDAGEVYDEGTGEIMVEAARPRRNEGGLADELTRVPGLVGAVTDWICETARTPSRPLALAAALVTIGTLAGRRFAGPTGSGTHLYIMSLALTGAGKQHPQNCVARLLKAAGKSEYVGAPSYMSMSAVIRELQGRPVAVSCMDEFGAFLKRVNSRKASSHERGISEVLRNLWGLSFESYRTPAWASMASQDVGTIAFSLLGSSTPDELIGALSGDDINNGFLNRFLVIDGARRGGQCEPEKDARKVPLPLAKALSAIPHGQQVLAVGPNPDPEKVPWGMGARDVFEGLSADCVKRIDQGAEGLYFARTAEIAVRLATIAAIGVDPSRPVLTEDLMAWAAKLAIGCAEWIAEEAESRMTEELNAAQIGLKIQQVLARGPMAYRDLHRRIFRNVRNANDLKGVLSAMETAGVIRSYPTRSERGPPTVTWALTG